MMTNDVRAICRAGSRLASVSLWSCASFAAATARSVFGEPGFDSRDGLVLRTGNSINLMVKPLGEVSIDCGSDAGKLLFTYRDGKRIYPTPRMMVDASSNYHPPVDLAPADVAALKVSFPLMKVYCARIKMPDWHIVTRDSDDITLVDAANLDVSGRRIAAWLAYDYPGLALDPPFQAPYAQKREFVRIDCAARTWAITAGYDLDEKGHVTDMAIFPDARFEPPGKDDLVVIDTLCNSDKRDSLPTFVPREKLPLNSSSDDLSVNPVVLANIQALTVPHAPKALKRYAVDGNSVFQGKPGNHVYEDNSLAFDARSGLTRISKKSNSFHSEEISFMGFFDVASIGYFGHDKISEFVTQVRFDGDWANMRVGSTFGYSAARSMKTEFSASPRNTSFSSVCTVENEVPANTLLPVLTGKAKKITCKRNPGTNLEAVDHGYFFLDYGWYIPLKTDPNGFYWSNLKVLGAE